MNKKRILAFAILHLIITFGCVLFSFGAGMDRFDNPRDPTLIEKTIEYITLILMSPLYWLWTPWMSKNVHNSIEWLLFLLNSGLWGLVLEHFYSKFKLRKIST
jgi:hypothetical protein